MTLDAIRNKYSATFTIEWGHRTCHPETCQCWNYRVYQGKYKKNVYNTDCLEDLERYCKANSA